MSVDVTVPALGESIVEATVGQWLKAPGDPIEAGDALVELETDKVNVEVSAPAGGTLQSIVAPAGVTVNVGDILGVVAEGQGTAGSPAAELQDRSVSQAAASTGSIPAGTDNGDGARVTPLAKRVASQAGVDLTRVPGTGPGGRITRGDVESFLETASTMQATIPAATAPVAPSGTRQAAPPVPQATDGRWEERVRMSRRRQTIARRLVEAQHTAAMLTTFNEIDMSAVMDVRKRRRDAFKERHGINLGFMSFFTRAVVGALKAYPRLNAEIDGDDMILKHYYDIGIAVGADEGLVVPVVRDADRLSFAQIEKEIADLASRARSKQLTLEELQGGTFTITNGGIFGSLMSTPILNAPQVGILGMHKIQERPMVVEGEIAIRPMMYVALSYDHRIVDGDQAVRFLVRVKELVEDPESLLLEG